MTEVEEHGSPGSALIVGGGAGISASCARLFADNGMRVAVAARTIDKPELRQLAESHGIRPYACDASEPKDVQDLFQAVSRDLGTPRLVVHNIDGRIPDVFGKGVEEVDPDAVQRTIANGAFSAFLVGQAAYRAMLANAPDPRGGRGTIIFTNASASMKGFAKSAAFAMACQAKAGLAQSLAREAMPRGIHVASVPIDAAIGRVQPDGTRAHWAAGATDDDNMAHPDYIAEEYWHLHRQHRSTWAFEVALRPWNEKW